MTENTAARIRLIYGAVLALLIAAVGVLLAVSCISIYRSGERPFTPEAIGAHWSRIAIPFYICLAAGIGGGVLDACLPSAKARVHAFHFPMDRLQARTIDGTYTPDTAARIKRERRLRLILRLVTLLFWLGCAIPSLIYLFNTANFPNFEQNPTPEVIAACRLVLPLAVTAIGFSVATSLLADASAQREIALCRAICADESAIPVAACRRPLSTLRVSDRCKHAPLILRIALAVLALLFILLGVLGGDAADVLGKAIRICTECIGLG